MASEEEASEAAPAMGGGNHPPTYDEATDLEGPPPTYDSLYGRLRSSEDPSSFVATLHGAWVGCCGTAVALVGLSVLTLLPLAMLVVGTMHVDDCPVEPLIPVYLIISGALSILKTLLDISCKVRQRRRAEAEGEPADERRQRGTPVWLEGLLNVVLFSFFIAGTVWVYRNAWPDFLPSSRLSSTTTAAPLSSTTEAAGNGTEAPLRSRYCEETTYKLAFATITLSWVLFALTLVCCSGVLGCMCLILGLRGVGGSVERRSWDDEQTRTVDAQTIAQKERQAGPSYQATDHSEENPNAETVIAMGPDDEPPQS